MSRGQHTTPAWVDQLNEDVILKDTEDSSWFSGGYLGMPTRYHGETGFMNAYDAGYHKGHRDDLSLRTRSTVSARRRRNSCCLALFLIFAALLVAIGVGLMVYYLLRPEPGNYQARIANGSLPLLNVPYTDEMQNDKSETFKDLEKSLCHKLDVVFEGSVYKDQYDSCKIEFLRLDDSPTPCACSNITSPNNVDNAKAYINLVFRGDIHRDMVHTIIDTNTIRVVGLDYDVLLLDEFIVDIESHPEVSTPTAMPPPDVGVRANLTIWVYNLTYTSDLNVRDSDKFRALAGPFCKDLRRMFLTSDLKSRYHSCRVQNFSSSPDIVITDVWFTGDDTINLVPSVKDIILNKARKVNVSGQVRKMIGTLLITPASGNDSTVTVIPIPLNPETTITPTPSTRPPNWTDGMPYIELMLNFTGVDFNSSLWDTGSPYFSFHANKFCKDLERMILQSSWKQHYYDCNMLNIYPPGGGQLYPQLRSVLHVTSNTQTSAVLVDIIKQFADKYIFPDNIQTYKIGDFYIILTDDGFSIYTTKYATDTTFTIPPTATVFPSIFTSYSFSTPTRTAGTAIPPVSTIVIVYNATAAYVESQLVDFVYTQELQDSTSGRFMLLEQQFCDDMDDFFTRSSLGPYYKSCKIQWFSSDPKFSFVLHFVAPKGGYLQTAVPSVIIDKAPKAQIGMYTVLRIGDLNLLYDAIGFTVSATNYTMDRTPSISPTTTVTMTATVLPPIYSATLVNIVCDVASDIIPGYEDKTSDTFRLLEMAFCKAISDIFANDPRTSNTYLDCYILQFSSASSTVQFHAIFAEDATQDFGNIVVDMVHLLSDSTLFEQNYHLDIGGLIVESYSCRMNVYPVNYTDPQTTMFTTLIPTSQIILPTAGFQHCLRDPCKNGGTCIETIDFYTCHCAHGFTGQDCEFDIDECSKLSPACENEGTCVNQHGGYECTCYAGYIGDRCEIVIDRCASGPCQNGGSCTGSPQQLCICAPGWQGPTCEEDVDECSLVPSVCKFNGNCINEIGSFDCQCVDGRTGPTCNEGIDECLDIQPCQNGASCLDTDYSYKCICKEGWVGVHCTDDDDECSRDICENDGTCTNTVGGFECSCTSGWTGPTCNTRYDECEGVNPCQNNGICVDTSSDFQCLCKKGWTGEFCETDIDECLDTSICNGNGECENYDGGFRCVCDLQWEGILCDTDHDECSDSSLGQLCYNGGQCINQWGSYSCSCTANWTGQDCMLDIDECSETPPVCLHDGTCTNEEGGFICTCVAGWTGNICQIDLDECLTSPCENNGTCTNKVGSFLCSCGTGWRGMLCEEDIDECTETPGVCRNGGTCYNEQGDYRCQCPEGRGGKNCDYSTDPCSNILCAHGGECFIETSGDPKCNCTEQFQGEFCQEDFDECSLDPCVHGQCRNLFGTFYCDCDTGFTGDLCDTDDDECFFYQCLHGYCNNTVGSFQCVCDEGWTGQFCNDDITECSLLLNPCNGNGRCEETPGSYKCVCYIGYEGQFCQDDFDECSQLTCENGGVCYNYLGGYQCNCSHYWTGPFCTVDLNECTTLDTPCLNGGTCLNKELGYDCTCTSQWRGHMCEEDVDECNEIPDTCLNNGACTNIPGDFQCNCTHGYEGKRCENDINECLANPCQNNGACEDSPPGDYTCVCTDGWTGKDCDIDINECLLNPCLNNGACENSPPGDYTCVCTDGWTGKDCDIDIDECVTNPCQNNGTCENIPLGDYTCMCTLQWTGKDCEIDEDECLANPCQNNGACENSPPGDYTCVCTDGWTGKDCDIDIDECLASPCQNNGVCENSPPGDYTCLCTVGWTGKDCETDIDECLVNPCQNNGACENSPAGDYTCVCTDGWTGKDCDIDVDECLANPCQNNGVCENSPPGDYTCVCTDDWTGKDCTIEVARCPDCQNGGICVDDNNNFKCVCSSGWQGTTCETDIDECLTLPSPCLNGGTCNNEPGTYICTCLPGFEGDTCQINIDECVNGPCLFGGTCIDGVNSYTCDCPVGRDGDNCENDVDECLFPTSPCENGGTCTNTAGSFICVCTDRWTGQLCQIDKDECGIINCFHGGTCVNTIGSFNCEDCDNGWEGQLCNTDINECELSTGNACQNGATCSNLEGSFECQCTDGWRGLECSTDIDECLEYGTLACYENGDCTNTDGDFMCNCYIGYTGQRCDEDINECDEDPALCMNGGICTNYFGTYDCECTPGFEGQHCEIDIDECVEYGTLACYENGDCTNTDGGFLCNCYIGYTGQRCDEDINECDEDPALCMNGGICTNYIGTYNCECTPGFEGNHCELDIDECLEYGTLACYENGDCTNTDGDFMCNCYTGYTGQRCDEDINECDEDPALCMNGGICTNYFGTYDCECTAGFEGNHCELDIDECSAGVCIHFASCLNAFGSYTCTCLPGWNGPNCDIDIDECLPGDICQNGGTCVNNDGSFTCVCTPGWEGPVCDTVGLNTFELTFETVGLTISPDLLDPQSDAFIEKQDSLCSDISSFTTTYLVPYLSCNIVTFSNNPNGLTLRLSFDDDFPPQIGSTQILDLLFENREKIRFDDVYGIRVGGMVFKHSDFISTDVTMTKQLVNFTYTPDLRNENSFAFQQYENAFCTDVTEIMTINALTFPNFTSCDVTDISYDTQADESTVGFSLEFEWIQNTAEIMANFDAYIDNNLPKVYFDQFETARLGDFNIYIRILADYTLVPVSYILLDVPWSPDLANTNSDLFGQYSLSFCEEISSLVAQYSTFADSYGNCNVESYSDQTDEPLFVSVSFDLEFFEMLDIDAVRAELSDIIDNTAQRERYNGYVGLRVGDLVLYDSIADYFDIPYDGWIANFTFSLFDYSSFTTDLLDPTSAYFKSKQKAFCDEDPEETVQGLKPYLLESFYGSRFLRCFVHSYTFDVLSVSDSLISTVSLLFLGKEPVLSEDLIGIIEDDFIKVAVGGDGDYYFIGYDLVKVKFIDEIKVNISDYVVGVTTTTPFPVIADRLSMRFPLLNFTSYDDYRNTSTFLYQNSSEWYCNDMSKMFDVTIDDLPKYAGCGNIGFTEEDGQTYITFELEFTEVIANETEAVSQLLRVITEKGKRATLPDSTVAIVLGPFMIYQDSLQPSITNPEIFRTPSPTGRFASTTGPNP